MYSYIKENRVKILLLPLIFYWIILFIGTSIPGESLSNVLEIGDKLKHFLAYLILAYLISFNLQFQEKWELANKFNLIFAFLISALYGIFDELHQILIPNRSAELYDWIADIFGAFGGIILAYLTDRFILDRSSSIET